ncbi:MAG: hypothetical protein RL189_3177 [Pseudomonadota bacterium]
MIQKRSAPEQHDLLAEQLWLTIDSERRIATLNFDIRKSRNAVSLQVAEALAHLSRQIAGSDNFGPLGRLIRERQILLLVLRSHCPDVFLSGGDLRELAAASETQGRTYIGQMREFTQMLRTGPLVSVAVLNGLAAGGGAEIALATDLRAIVSSTARVYFAQSLWGVPAGWGMMTDLTNKGVFFSERRRGIAMAAQDALDVQKLESFGLADARFDTSPQADDACIQWLGAFADRLGQCPPELRTALIAERPQHPADKLAEFDKELFDKHWLAAEHRNRLNFFLAQRSEQSKKR